MKKIYILLGIIIVSVSIFSFGQIEDNSKIKNLNLSSEEIARNYIIQNSTVNKFRLEKGIETENFISYYVIPENKNIDEARILLKKNKTGFEVIAGPSTAFPGLDEQYPELKGKF